MVDFASILRELKGTPLHYIFAGAGIVFLLIAVGVQIRTSNSTRNQQIASGVIGAILLIISLAILFVPPTQSSQSPSPTSPTTQPTALPATAAPVEPTRPVLASQPTAVSAATPAVILTAPTSAPIST